MSAEKTLLLEALQATEDLDERVTDSVRVVASVATLAEAATNLAEAAQREISELRRAVAKSWVIDNLDNESVWCKPSVMEAACEVRSRAWEACGGPLAEANRPLRPLNRAHLKHSLAEQADDTERAFIGHVVQRAATAAVARDGFEVFRDHFLVVEVSDLKWSEGCDFPGFSWTTSYASR